ncbi:MAG: hypothetical protein R6W69_05715 [Anaerolineales bacterium]
MKRAKSHSGVALGAGVGESVAVGKLGVEVSNADESGVSGAISSVG